MGEERKVQNEPDPHTCSARPLYLLVATVSSPQLPSNHGARTQLSPLCSAVPSPVPLAKGEERTTNMWLKQQTNSVESHGKGKRWWPVHPISENASSQRCLSGPRMPSAVVDRQVSPGPGSFSTHHIHPLPLPLARLLEHPPPICAQTQLPPPLRLSPSPARWRRKNFLGSLSTSTPRELVPSFLSQPCPMRSPSGPTLPWVSRTPPSLAPGAPGREDAPLSPSEPPGWVRAEGCQTSAHCCADRGVQVRVS